MKKSSEDLAKKNASLRVQKTKLKKKVKSLEETLKEIEQDVTAEGFIQLNEKAADIPKSVFENFNKRLNPTSRENDPIMKKFALSLHLKSAKAYRYVRKCFQNTLPAESTIRAWCQKTDFSPGFCDAALIHLSHLVCDSPFPSLFLLER